MLSGSDNMSIKMKGLLKGLRYISQIFDAKEEDEDEEEEEMQIGLPTDVKHVAHIGWDGPAVTSPSWMNDLRPTPQSASAPLNSSGEPKEKSAQKSSSQELSSRDLPDIPLPKTSRRRQSAGSSSFDSTTQDPQLDAVPKQSSRRQKQASAGLAPDSPGRDETSFEGVKTSKKSSKEHKEDAPSIPKQSRRKKTKGSSSGGSTKSRPVTSSTTSTYTSPFSDPGAALNNNGIEGYSPTAGMNGLKLGEKECDTSSVS